jgi:hypothetical protein
LVRLELVVYLEALGQIQAKESVYVAVLAVASHVKNSPLRYRLDQTSQKRAMLAQEEDCPEVQVPLDFRLDFRLDDVSFEMERFYPR